MRPPWRLLLHRLTHAAAATPSLPPPRDTIAAAATAAGPAALAVVRLSGPAAPDVLLALTGRHRLPAPRTATLVRLRAPATGALLDTALALRFEAAASYTGEPAVELHVHGGPAVVAAVLEASLGALPATRAVRLAAPGEFTRRRFDAGLLNLTEAEGVADLTAARSEAARAAAAALADGALTRALAGWRAALVDMLALAEAAIDFEDDPGALSVEGGGGGGGGGGGTEPASLTARLPPLAASLAADLAAAADAAATAELARSGVRVALAGRPNAGKSSLANALARRAASIVSAVPGTTRDVVATDVVLGAGGGGGGTHVVVCDAAGVREGGDASDAAEGEGIARARALAAGAPVVCVVVDGVEAGASPDAVAALADAAPAPGAFASLATALASRLPPSVPVVPVSAATGAGVPALASALAAAAAAAAPAADPAAPPPLLTRARHRAAVAEASAATEAAGEAAGCDAPERAAEEIRRAIAALDGLVGRAGPVGGDPEEVLDAVFAQFCVGK